MVKRLRNTLASLVFLKEEEAVYTARFVTYLLPICALLLLLFTIFPLMAGSLPQRLELGGPVLAAWAVAWLLLRRGHVRRAALVFVVGTWVMTTYAAVTAGGVQNPSYVLYLAVIAYTAFLVSPAAAAALFLASVLAGAGMVAAQYAGRLPPAVAVHTPITLWASYSAEMFGIILLVVIVAHEYRAVFGRWRANEERARLLFEAARDPILLLSADGRFLDGNDAAARAFGVASRRQLVEYMPADFSPEMQPDGLRSAEKAEQMIRTAFQQGSVEFEWTHRRTDGSEFVADIALTLIPAGAPPVLMAHLRDITGRRQAEKGLLRQMQLEEVIIGASTRFINVHLDQLDREIDNTLERLGRFAGADRAYVFQRPGDGEAMDCTHEWCREGISVQIHRLQNMAAADFPWFAARLLAGEVILVPRVRDLPPEAAAERQEFERQGIESLICVPMMLGDRAVGFLGFDSVCAEDAWSDDTVTLLRVAADAVTNALARRRAQQVLRASEERYRSLVETTSDWIWEVDQNGVYTYASPKVRDLLGYDPSEVVGRTPFDFMPPEEAEQAAVRMKLHQAEPIIRLENRKLHKDGHEVVLETSGAPVFDDRGAFRGFRGIDRDITGQKRVEEALRESQARYQRFLQMSVEGIWRLDAEPPIPTNLDPFTQAELILERGRVAECNDALARRYGFARPEDVVGARLDDLWVEVHEVKIAALLQFIRAGYRISDLETTGHYTDGRPARFLNNLVGQVEEGRLVLAWGTMRDVTAARAAAEALRRERDLVSTIMDTSPVGVTALDRDGHITFANAEAEAIFGLSKSEVTERTYNAPDWRITDHEGQPFPDEELPFRRVKSTGRAVYGVRHAIERPDGQRVLLSINAAPLLTETGEFEGMVAAIDDVTELARAEEALRASEERFRAIVESTRDWIWFADTGGINRYSNRAIHDLLGHAPEEIVGRLVFEFMHPEDVPIGREQMERAIGERGGWSGLVVRWQHQDGTHRYLESTASPAFSSVGALLGWYGVDRDITERIQTEEALRHSEARLRALFAAMTDVIFVMDPEGRYREIAPTKPDLLYRPADQLLGRTVHEIFAPEQADFFLDSIRRVLATGQTTQIEYSLPIAGRELRFVATLSPLSPDRVIVVARDVTTQVEQYERLLAVERARADLAEHLNEEINHRARNNLAMVSGLLQMQALQESDLGVASRLREAVARIRTFVDIHEKIYATSAEQVDLTEVLRQVAATLRSVYATAGAVFTVEGEPILCPTRAATNLAVVTNELVTNALKYGAGGPEGKLQVMIRAEHSGGQVRLSVWNSGNPVPEGFDPTAQHGMGLRLVSDVVQQYGGAFRVVPQRGGTLAESEVPEEALAR